MSTIQVTDLRLEHHRPTDRLLAVETATPRLSWCVVGAPAGWEQSGYEVEVSRGAAGTGTAQPTAVQTLTVDSCEQVLVPWPTAPLASRESATLRVRLRGTDGALTGWSRPVEVEAALLDPSEWQADFIAPVGIGEPGGRAPVISRTLEVPNGTVRARLRATGHGLIEPRVNGTRVDDSVLNPGWTSYAHRLQVVTWDVTDLLTPGTHTLDVLLGNGWWRGHVGYFGMTQRFGTRLALAAQLELTGPDGALTVIATADDGTWTAHESAVTADDLYDGQSTDLRLAPDLTGPADDGASTHPVEVVPAATREDESATIALVPQSAPLVRPTGLLPARRVWTSPSGRTLVDFGQNAVGVVRLTVRGLEAGTEVTLRHAEVLEDGELATRPLRAARATDTWVLDGPAERVLEPTLTLHGLRYAEVTGVPHLAPEDVSLVVIGSDMQPTGSFTCSDDLLNRLHANTVWSTRGNFVSIPTDCPQRDERLGWTGDIQAFAPTASFLFDTISFLASWLTDLRAEQHENGSVPHVVPMFMPSSTQEPSAAAWGDAATTVPVDLYEASGDLEVLRAQLPSMTAWVEREAALAGEDLVWSGGFQFGDWLDPTAPPERPADAKADPDVVATAYLARSAHLVARAAALLGEEAAAERCSRLAQDVRAAYNRAFVTPAGRIHSDAQTVYAQAIVWDLLETPAQRDFAGQRLADLVRLSGFRIATGFVGTPLVLPALVATGHVDVAGRLLTQTECPSWLYPVTMGATTIWERWDSMLPDGSVNPGEMTSFNHYALGAVADWLHRGLAGLAPAAPGWRRVSLAPVPLAGITSAAASHLSPYGEVSVSWQVSDGDLHLEADLPVGMTGTIRLPGAEAVEVAHGHHELSAPLPDAGCGPVLTVRDLIDDADTWGELVAVMADADNLAIGSAELARRMKPLLDSPASAIAWELTPDPRFAPKGLRERIEAVIVRATEREGGTTV